MIRLYVTSLYKFQQSELTSRPQPTFYALYRSFTQCLFIEEEGDIVFYKNKDGVAVREVEQSALKEIKASGWNPEEQDRVDVLGAKTD